MPDDPGGEVAAGLRARLAAVGGTLAVAGDGGTEILLPAPRDVHDGPAPARRAGEDEEVATSPRE
jgi:hypothetical protein